MAWTWLLARALQGGRFARLLGQASLVSYACSSKPAAGFDGFVVGVAFGVLALTPLHKRSLRHELPLTLLLSFHFLHMLLLHLHLPVSVFQLLLLHVLASYPFLESMLVQQLLLLLDLLIVLLELLIHLLPYIFGQLGGVTFELGVLL